MLKVSWKDILPDFSEQFLKVNYFLQFYKKSSTDTTTLMHCQGRQVWRNLFSSNQGNGSEITFVAEATKIGLKYLKIQLSLNDLMQTTI